MSLNRNRQPILPKLSAYALAAALILAFGISSDEPSTATIYAILAATAFITGIALYLTHEVTIIRKG